MQARRTLARTPQRLSKHVGKVEHNRTKFCLLRRKFSVQNLKYSLQKFPIARSLQWHIYYAIALRCEVAVVKKKCGVYGLWFLA